jgi:hypothetical protein
MFGWLRSLWRSIAITRPKPARPGQPAPQLRSPARPAGRSIAAFTGQGEPPPMHWKSCHPRTRARFKASMTCAHGHAIVLSGHRISENGEVHPSVVCRTPGCDFHDWVLLKNWTDGAL